MSSPNAHGLKEFFPVSPSQLEYRDLFFTKKKNHLTLKLQNTSDMGTVVIENIASGG